MGGTPPGRKAVGETEICGVTFPLQKPSIHCNIADMRQQIINYIKSLPRDDQVFLALYFHEHLSMEEIEIVTGQDCSDKMSVIDDLYKEAAGYAV